MNTPDVENTAEAIEAAAKQLRRKAEDLDRLAARMRERGDLNYAAEAVNEVVNVVQLCRLDLLVARPLRALGL